MEQLTIKFSTLQKLKTHVIVAVGMNSIKEKMINLRRLKNRLAINIKNSEPILAYYKEQGLLNTIDGAREIDAVFADVQKIIEK